jgi:hypothetical protein
VNFLGSQLESIWGVSKIDFKEGFRHSPKKGFTFAKIYLPLNVLDKQPHPSNKKTVYSLFKTDFYSLFNEKMISGLIELPKTAMEKFKEQVQDSIITVSKGNGQPYVYVLIYCGPPNRYVYYDFKILNLENFNDLLQHYDDCDEKYIHNKFPSMKKKASRMPKKPKKEINVVYSDKYGVNSKECSVKRNKYEINSKEYQDKRREYSESSIKWGEDSSQVIDRRS